MTASRRFGTLSLQLIALAVIATVAIVLWLANAQTPAHAQVPANQAATGRPAVLPSAEGAGILLADLSGINDPNGLTYNDDTQYNFSYQWIRVDGDTSTETNVGADSTWYQNVDADIGNLIKVEVSFTDGDGYSETVTSLSFGPLTELAGPPVPPSAPPSTLVSNTGTDQSSSATATINQQYAMGFTLGDHGQGYEISSVSIDLAAAPSSLTVSLWIGAPAGNIYDGVAAYKLFDFENPPSFQVGLNRFTAPAGAFAYQNVSHFIVLSGFGSSLSIKETTSDIEDLTSEYQATLFDNARVRALNSTGRWSTSTSRTSVLRLAVEGSRRFTGILASSYAQDDSTDQENVSLDDEMGLPIGLGAADRYLIRGFSWLSDDTTSRGGGMHNQFDLRSGWTAGAAQSNGQQAISASGTKLFSLIPTRYEEPGINVWAAPQGATVAGSSSYLVYELFDTRPDGVTLSRVFTNGIDEAVDSPTASGVTLPRAVGDFAGRPRMAVLGEALYAMVQNLGQTDNSYVSVGGANKVLSQGFTTGPDSDDYSLQGFGVNIEGSGSKFPDGPLSVSVSVHADSGGKPGAKLFDLVSPGLFGAGHSFFEAPPGTTLEASTSYVLVWSHLAGTEHRLRKTSSDSEDSGARTGFAIANAFYQGADLDNMAVDSGSDVLEIAVYGRAPKNVTGAPTVLASAEDAGVLAVDTSGIGDPDGIPNVGDQESTGILHDFSYRWIRVDGDTETVVGAGSARYRHVEADVGKLIKVQVSFIDKLGTFETVTSLPFGPIARSVRSGPPSTLVSNTGQKASATAMITGQYAMGFKLGDHGQGYEISSVSIDLAAVPSGLTVSLWMGRAPGGSSDARAYTKLFDFANPSSFKVGLNRFTAPAGAFAYQNLEYYIVLSGFGSSLSIKETTSDDEDEGGETGATLGDNVGSRAGVLRLAIKGSKRKSGILVSTYAQLHGNQELVSLGDDLGLEFTVGAADRYLIRGVSFSGDDTTTRNGLFTNPWDVRDGTNTLFRLVSTRQIFGINEFTAPQGATVAGSDSYEFFQDVTVERMGGVVLGRHFCTPSTDVDSPTVAGVTLDGNTGMFACNPPLMAVFGEPLVAMVQNLGQTNNVYVSLGGTNAQVLSQGFTTGSDEFGYRLQGIGVNIEGSGSNLPDGPTSVSVAVHADSGGKPGAKLYDLFSPTEFATGHSFFEAPPGTHLLPDTSYVLVWRYNRGTWHRLHRTTNDSEDTGALTGSAIADAFYRGADLDNLSVDSNSNALSLAVYTVKNDKEPLPPFVEGGYEVTTRWLHIPEDVDVGYQFRVLFVTLRGTLPTSGDIADYNEFVQEEAAGTLVRGKPVRDIPAAEPYTDPVIRAVADEFKAVVCTAAVDAVTNTDIAEAGALDLPIHWLDGGWQDRPTLIANSNADFYGDEWVNTEYGAYVTGNSAYFHENAMVWTGCDASGVADPLYPMGAASPMGLVAVGTPNDPAANNAPIGAVDASLGRVTASIDGYKPLYAISPIFTVVP